MNTLVTRSASAAFLGIGLAACGGSISSDSVAATPMVAAAAAETTAPVEPNEFYVAETGSDSSSGTQSAPFKTILKASQVAKPGVTVHVAAGSYPGSFETTANGTATARIRYVSDVRGGARIVPPANSTSTTAWWNKGSYVDIDGFEVDGTHVQNGQRWWAGIHATGSHTVIKDNTVHHIATTAADCAASGANGGAGIVSDNYYGAADIDVVANVVHHIGSAGCISIHGIYIAASGNVINNVAYQIGSAGILSWHDAHHITIANNTLSENGFGILVGNSATLADYINVSNNIVFNNLKGIAEEGNVGIHNTYTNNLVYQNGALNWSLNNTHSGDISADPQFVNADGGDYRLKSTSPAINKGSPAYAPSTDMIGTTRPQGAGIDLGALQHKAN